MAHKEASAWVGKGATALRLSGRFRADAFRRILEGEVLGGRRLGRRELDGSITHRPGRNVTLSSPKSVSLMAIVGGEQRILGAHDKAVGRTLAWIEGNAVEIRMAAIATGNAGDAGAIAPLVAELAHNPSAAVIEALASIGDEDAIVHLGRCAERHPALADTVIDVLRDMDSPRADRLVRRLEAGGSAA